MLKLRSIKTSGIGKTFSIVCVFVFSSLPRPIVSGAQSNTLNERLIAAVMAADASSVKALLDQGADSGTTTNSEDGITVLMLAASGSGPRTSVLTLPAVPANMNLPDLDRDDRPVMKLLVAHGANVNAEDRLGRTALWYSSVGVKKVLNTQFLLEQHADVEAADHSGITPLMGVFAASYGNPESRAYAVFKMLIAANANVNIRNAEGRPLLHTAVSGGYLQVARDLLDAGADINGFDQKGMTPLMTAVSAEQVAMTEMLLVAGASLEHEDHDGDTALSLAASRRPQAEGSLVRLLLDAGANATRSSGEYAFERACLNGYVDAMHMLLAKGANPNALVRHNNPTRDMTVLMRTSQSPHVEPIELLLASGAKIDATQRNGDTALMWAVGTPNNAAVVKLLLARGLNPNAQTSGGWTALMKTVGSISEPNWPASAYVDTVRALLEGGADVSVKNDRGVTALMLAQRYPAVVALLEGAGR